MERRWMCRLAAESRAIGAALLAVALSGCGGADGSVEGALDKTGSVQQAVSSYAGGVPVPAYVGTLRPSWKGTYPELLAADALAECSLLQLVGITDGGITDSDAQLASLATKISNAQCTSTPSQVPPGYSAVEAFYFKWLDGRKTDSCNIDVASQTNRGMDITYSPKVGTASAYGLPPTSDFTAIFGGSEVGQGRQFAQNHVHYAWLNLCMAQKLRAQLDSSQVALVSQADLLQLQTWLRDRAQAAVYQYANILRTLDANPTVTNTIPNPWLFLNILNRWKDKDPNWNSKAAELGRDLAAAVQLLVQATDDRTTTLLRSRSAQTSFGTYRAVSYPQGTLLPNYDLKDAALTGPRTDALLGAYGAYRDSVPHAVVTQLHPQVAVLLGILQRANQGIQLVAANKTFDLGAMTATVYNTAESYVRTQLLCVGSTDPTCGSIPPGSPVAEGSWLSGVYGINAIHARQLVQALIEHLYGRPAIASSAPDAKWTYAMDSQLYIWGLPIDLQSRIIGTHTYSGNFNSASGGTLTLDKNFKLVSPGSVLTQGQAWTHVPDPGLWLTAHPYDQGFDYRINSAQYLYYPEDSFTPSGAPPMRFGSQLGAQSVLAYVRLALSRSGPNVAPIVKSAGAALYNLLRAANGSRQVVLRHSGQTAMGGGPPCSAWTYTQTGTSTVTTPSGCTQLGYVSGPSGHQVQIWVNTTSGDPYTTLVRRYLTTGTDLTTPAGPAATTFPLTPVALDADATGGEVIMNFNLTEPTSDVVEYRLRDAAGNEVPLFRGILGHPSAYPTATSTAAPFPPALATYVNQNGPSYAHSITYGGNLNARMERIMGAQTKNWGRPIYDALDIPTDWAPVGDASLFGGQPGQEAYQYFLQSAKNAAQDATRAADKAFQSLADETTSALDLAQAEQKGATVVELQRQALCGAAATCDEDVINAPITIPPCGTATPNSTHCENMRTILGWYLGGVAQTTGLPLAKDVYDARDAVASTFDAYAGGQMQGLLLAQWNAWQGLKTALANAVNTANTGASTINRAVAEENAAQTLYDKKFGDIIIAAQAVKDKGGMLTSEQMSANAEKTELDTKLADAEYEAKHQCKDKAVWDRAFEAGKSYSGSDQKPYINKDHQVGIHDLDSRSYSQGPIQAQHALCDSAKDDRTDARRVIPEKVAAVDAKLAVIQQQIDELNILLWKTLTVDVQAAIAERDVAPTRTAEAISQAMSNASAQIGLLEQALSNVFSSGMAIGAAIKQANLAVQRQKLDTQISVVGVKTRFNLKRATQSYDLWRARALSENARRLAVAARRAVESRFLVDLSSLSGSETFVDAPAVWADEIYDSDLKPPSSLGKTAGPTGAGDAVYTSKIEDYVNNLQLFVNGYAISRPTAIARTDTEVVQLPGPAAVVRASTVTQSTAQVRDPRSAGWSFLCDYSFYGQVWVDDPHSADFNVADWSVSTLCSGAPPIAARTSFWLDAWGEVNGWDVWGGGGPHNDRHNARWRGLAVNLVGTGIRDCSKTSDPSTCYQEPFIRYSLRHVGPALISDYAQQMRSLELPIGSIEGGKALTAEEWLDPVSNGFDKSLVANVQRTEFAGRPFGGQYELTLELTPDVRPERIDRIQVLQQSDYWVRQQ